MIKPCGDFEQVPARIIRECTPETIGVYCKLLTFGEQWSLNIHGLATCMGLSQDRVRSAIVTLEVLGYIVRKAVHKDGRLKGWDYIIYGNAVKDDERSHAGFSLSQIQSCPKSANTENDQDNIIILDKDNHTNKDIHINNNNNYKGESRFKKPSLDEVKAYADSRNSKSDAAHFYDYYEGCGWMVGKNHMKDWKAAFRNWERNDVKYAAAKPAPKSKSKFEQNLHTIEEMFGGQGYDE